MQFPERQQLFAIVFAFIMVTSMMSTGALASGGGADEIEQTEPSDFTSQYDVSENESDTDDELSTTSSGSENVSVETVPDPETGVYTATLEGNITELEADSADVFFQWRPVSEDGETEIRTTTVESVSTEGPFTESVTFLDPGTTYEFQAVADTENETVNGGFEEFTTDEGQDTDGFIEASDDVRLFNLFFKSTRTKVPDDETVGMQTGIPDVQLEVFGGTLDVYPGPGDKETLPVYQQSENIELTLSSTQLDRFSGSEVDLVAVETDTSEGLDAFSQISQIDELLNDENTDVDVFDTIELDDSDRDVTFENADDSGNYVFLVTNAGSVSVDDTGNVTTDDVRVVGLDFAAVQDDSSDVSTARPQYRPGENVTVETEAPFENENDITQAVILYDEDDLGSQDITAEIDDLEDIDPNNLTIESDIAAVDGVRQVEDGATFMGESLGERDETGIFSVDDIFSFVGGNIGENVDTEGGNVLNASMVAKADTGSEATFEVETLENFTESEDYSIIHVAESNETGEIYTNKEQLEITSEPDPFLEVDIDEDDSVTQIIAGEEAFVVNATVTNVGGGTAEDDVSLFVGGEQATYEFDDFPGDEEVADSVSLAKFEDRTISLEFDTSDDATIEDDGDEFNVTYLPGITEGDSVEAELRTETGTDSVTINLADDPANVEVDINEDASVTEVAAGEPLTINATLNNTGGLQTTQDITATLENGDVSETVTQEVTIDGNTETAVEFEVDTVGLDAGEYTVTVASEDDSDTVPVTLLEAPFFDVEITEFDDTVGADEEVLVNATVENVGEAAGTQDVEFLFNDSLVDTEENVELDADQTEELSFTATATEEDIGERNVTVQSDDDVATETVTVLSPPDFQVNIDEDASDSAVTPGETATIVADVENIGDQAGAQDIVLELNGEEVDSEDLSVDAGETGTVTFEYEADDVDPSDELEFTVSSDDDTAQWTVNILEPGIFDVSIDEQSSVTEVNQTETVVISVSVTNTGDVGDEQPINFELRQDGELNSSDTQNVTIESGESETVEFTYDTTVDDRGEFTATVFSADDNDSTTVTVNEPAEFDVNVTDPAEGDEFAPGETITVTSDVENLGDVAGTQDLRLLADGAEVTSESVTIPANETDTVTIPFETDEDDIGTLNLTVVSDDTADTVNVTVLDTFFELELAEADDEATRGDDVEFVVDIENIGAAGTDTITVVDDDDTERVNESVTLETGASTTQVLSVPTFDDDNATVEFTIASSEDEVTTSVSLFDPADFEVEIDIDDPESGDRYNPEVDDLNGTVNVTNLGERTDTQTVTVEFDNEEIASQNVELDGSNSTNVTFNRTLTAADAGDRVIAAESDDNVAVETISVIQPGTFTVDIIEEESNLDVVAGQNGTVVAEITNVGETTVERTVTLTNVTESSDVEIASKDIKLGAGVDTDFEKEFETDATTPSELDLEVAAEDDDGDVVTATVEDRPSYFAVTIDELNPTEVDEPASGTTPVTVNGTVENLGTEGDNGTVTLTADGEEFATVSVDTDGDGNVTDPTFNETFDVERGDAPEVSVEAEAVRDGVTDGSDEETLDVTPLGELEVTIVEASNVSDLADQEFTPTINVTNVGEQDVNGTVELFFNGTSQTTASVSDLGDGDEATVIEPNDGFSINASDFDAGTFRLEAQVRNDITNERDDRSTARVSIGNPAEFEVTSVTLDPTGPVDRGDDVTINATIENVGDVQGNASVFFEFGDTEVGIIDIDDIDDGDTVSEEVTYTTRSDEVGPDRPVTVGTADDELTEEITVFDDAEFEVELDADDEAVAGDTVTALATVENVGGLAGNTTNVRLLASGANTANPPAQNVELGEGDSTVVEFEVEPEAAGDLDLVAVTSDDFDTDTVDVGTPGEIELELRSVTDPVTDEDNFAVRVDVENIGDGPVDDQRLRLQFDGDLVTNETVSLPGGESDRITLNHSISRSIAEGSEEIADYAVLAPADSIEGQVTIEPEPQDPFFRVDSLDAESEVFNQSTDVAVNATVTNIGNLTGTQDITFEIGDVTETNESVQLGEGNSTDFTFEFDPTEVGETGDVEYAIASENQTETDNITIAEPDPATPEIVDVDVDDSVSQNEQLTVEADIENVGDLELAPGTEEITLTYADGDVSNTTTIDETIAAGDTGTVEITVEPPAEARAGVFEREITVETEAFDLGDTVTESVDVNFEGIGSGIDEAGTGGTVVVAPGEYDRRSTLVIDTEVTIEAADRGDAPVIGEPRRTDDVAFRITTDDVELSGLEFAGQNDGTAVEVQADTSLTNIRVEDWETGIAELDGTSEMLAVDVVDTDVGIVLDGNGDSSIEFSRVARADDTGVVVESDDNLIRTSRVVNSPIGIEILGEDNRVEQTVVRNSADYGVIVSDVPGDLPNDPSATLNFNAFESNGLSVFADNSSVDATQNWWGSLVPRQNVDFTARSNLNASDPLDSRTDSDLVVDDVDIDEPVVQDEPFEVTATINNTGTVDDLQQIELVDDGSAIADEDLRVNASETETVTLTYTPDVTDGDELDLSVRSLDDERVEGTIDINDPAAFELDGLTADDPVAAGQTLTVTADVENIGDVEGEVTVQLRDFEGDIVATQSDLAIDGNTTQPVNLAWDTDTGDIGEDDVTVEIVKDETVVDADTLNVEVTDAELVSIDLDLDETEIDEGEDTTATVTATFTDSTDDVTSEATITSDDTDVASVSGATITGESDGTATIQAEYSVNGETETDTVDLTVNDDGPTGSPSGGGGAPTPPEPDEPVDVEPPEPPADVTVDLDETVDFEFDGETGQTTATFSEQSAVDSVTFDFEIAGSVNARTLDRESDETGPAPGASAAVSQISVGDELRDQPATIGMRVSQERLAEIDADAEDLRINRFADGEWQGLDTEIVDETDTHVRIQAETPGFSYFAASAVSEPEAAASVSPETVTTDETVELSGSESTDRYGEIVAYDWEIDGETLSGETTTLTVDEPGEYTAELTVTNDAGETDTTTVDFTVTAADDDDDDVPDDVDEEAFGTSAVAIIVLVIIAIFAAAGIAARRRKE